MKFAIICLSIAVILLSIQVDAQHWKRVSNSRIASEACESDGHVGAVYQQGKLLRIECSSGLIKLYQAH